MSIYENHRMKDPRLPFIFHFTRFSPGHPAGRGNWHENLELLYFVSGSATVTSNEDRLSLSAGEIAILNTNRLHMISTSSEEGAEYYCLIIDRSFCLANHFDTGRIEFDEIVRDKEISGLFDRLISEYAEDKDAPYRVQMIRSTVLRMMALLCRHHSRAELSEETDSHCLVCIKQALGRIHAHSEEAFTLDDIAEFVGMSKYHFAREFRRVTGHTFVAYVNLIRCEKAKALLSEGQMRIGDVARACGFESQSYFTKTFRKNTGELPNEYRKRKK